MKINTEIKLRRIFEDMYKVKEQAVVELKNKFVDDDKIEVLDDGTVRFFIDDTNNQLFAVGDDKLKPAGQKEIKDFIRRYISILFSPRYINYIDKIVIEGHTDSRGRRGALERENYLYNLRLSQLRAYSVAEFIHRSVMLSDDESKNSMYKELLREKLTASGRSYIDLMMDQSGKENTLLSRRVEFKFHLPMEKKYLEFRAQN